MQNRPVDSRYQLLQGFYQVLAPYLPYLLAWLFESLQILNSLMYKTLTSCFYLLMAEALLAPDQDLADSRDETLQAL